MLEKFIPNLVKELELEDNLATEVPGVYVLPFEDDLNITLSDKRNGFTLSSTLGPAKKQNEEDFFTRLMLGNLFGQGTKGAILGLSDDGNQLTLSQTIEYNIEYKEFRDILEDFVNSAEYWKSESKNFK
jgi:hypothetical protein